MPIESAVQRAGSACSTMATIAASVGQHCSNSTRRSVSLPTTNPTPPAPQPIHRRRQPTRQGDQLLGSCTHDEQGVSQLPECPRRPARLVAPLPADRPRRVAQEERPGSPHDAHGVAGRLGVRRHGRDPAAADVVIDDGRIVEVGPGLDGDEASTAPARRCCRAFRLPRTRTMMPHRHVRLPRRRSRTSSSPAAENLRATLRLGITTVRDAGGADLGVKLAVENGLMAGRGCRSRCRC